MLSYPLFRVGSWNNDMCCMSFYILMVNLTVEITPLQDHLITIAGLPMPVKMASLYWNNHHASKQSLGSFWWWVISWIEHHNLKMPIYYRKSGIFFFTILCLKLGWKCQYSVKLPSINKICVLWTSTRIISESTSLQNICQHKLFPGQQDYLSTKCHL